MKKFVSITMVGVLALLNIFTSCDSAKPAPELMVLSDYELILSVGERTALSVSFLPGDAKPLPVIWTSSDPECVTVNENGEIYAVKRGAASIRAGVEGSAMHAICEVTVGYPYIDEYGINHGSGVEIYGVIWAPVNCGFHETDFPYGKLYQWGRKDGQGYTGSATHTESDAVVPEISDVQCPFGKVPDANTWYMEDGNSGMWLGDNDGLISFDPEVGWNELSETREFKGYEGIGNPCPKGWRIPTFEEVQSLRGNAVDMKSASTYKAEGSDSPYGQAGRWYGPKHQSASAYDNKGCIFLPFGGERSAVNGGASDQRNRIGEYWTNMPNPDTEWFAVPQFINMPNTAYIEWKFSFRVVYGFSVRCVAE